MSSGCGDVLSLEDMKTAKKHQIFEAEVITGKAGGVTGGEDIDEASNAVTSQVQKTMPAILRDMGVEFEESQAQRESDFNASQEDKEARFQQFLLNSGYQLLGDYENGPYTITALNQIIRYQNELWRLNAATNPPYTTTGINSTSWTTDVTHLVSVGDANLRQELATSSGSAMIGMEQGGTVEDAIYWITPEMFGAKGDGVTDDTAAMQAAINACQYKTLIISNGKKYRTKNLTVPHPMTFRGLGRRQNGAIVPYGNVDAESFVHSGTLILITSSSTVTFYDLTINALNVALSTVDGYRLTGVGAADNSTGEYRPGFQMYNCNVSGFSGNNIYGGANRSFGILKDCQSESSGRTCITIDGVDWRIDHCYFGRSAEAHGISLTHESNAITNCDIYFNKRSGIFYNQAPGMTFIKIIGNTINSNGEHGITIGSPYDQPAGTTIMGNIFWNNSGESTGTYHNIDLSYGRGHVVSGNVHKQYSVASPTNAPRCGYCVNLRNGATLAGPLTDSIDPLYSYVVGTINVKTQSIFNQNEFTVGSGVEFTKKVGSSSGIGYRVRVTDENTDRTQVSPGKILLGDGFTNPTHGIQHLSAYPNVTMGVKGLGVVGNYSDSPLRIGTFRLWSGGDNTIRSKSVTDPTSATDGFILSMKVGVPATATSTGTEGQWAANTDYLYVCVAANTWRRSAIAAW